MARAARELFGDRIRAGLIVGVEPAADPEQRRGFQVIVGGHPTPSAASEQGGRRALELAASLRSDETLVVLLSGGASALMAVPADGVTLEDKQAATRQLLRAGADIHALNTVRKHLSAIKGGWLAARASGAMSGLRDLRCRRRRSERHRIRPDGAGCEHVSRCARHPSTLRRRGRLSACRRRTSRRAARRARSPRRPSRTTRRSRARQTTVIGGRRNAMDGAIREAESRGYHVIRIDDAVRRRSAGCRTLAFAGGRRQRGERRTPGVRGLERRNDRARRRRREGRQESGIRPRMRGRAGGHRRDGGDGERRHRRHRRPDGCGGRARRLHHRSTARGRRGFSRRPFSNATTPIDFSRRSATSFRPVRPARTSATSR